ncbi:DUF6668 family protein [Streptomyces sp. B3I8]|uniref:DUF6668 family protein n=1 Tax=Streptomyces sp. B3I8 TaxID=3042303 RepID=UPI00277FC56A|nr:DUF6668 family protein [Streptomyces sp. B3I8]MDQ0788538.1 hypothetical protein [Streptomyces sp. B3I8]
MQPAAGRGTGGPGGTGQPPGGPDIWLRGPVGDTVPPTYPAAPAYAASPARPGVPPATASPRRFSWVATHGGAGVTTLAAVFGGHDTGRAWPRPDHGEPPSVLLVGRTHATGLEAVANTLDIFRRGDAPPGLDLDAVVLVADAPGRLPRPLAQRVKAVEAAIDVYRVPWVTAWRTNDLSGRPPRECDHLARLTGPPGPPPARR